MTQWLAALGHHHHMSTDGVIHEGVAMPIPPFTPAICSRNPACKSKILFVSNDKIVTAGKTIYQTKSILAHIHFDKIPVFACTDKATADTR